MAKVLESHGKLNRLMDMLGDCTEITWDNQCMVERFACESVFQNTKCYEQCGKQVSIMRMNRIVRSMFCATRCWTGFMLCAGNMNPEEG
ncbi:MAG: hypothetical protein ACLVD8_26565 [Enterocloster sp.]|uniref:hypothetical protein n=1 Tax=Enterocloster sp. TaxID=2719315 RepID=UPI00399AC6AB